jgi:hypothetical protein
LAVLGGFGASKDAEIIMALGLKSLELFILSWILVC